MDKFKMQNYIKEKFDKIIDSYVRDIKAKIENSTPDEILKMEEEITFVNNINEYRFELIYLKSLEEVQKKN